MRIFLDQNEILELTPIQVSLLKHLIPADQIEERVKGMIYQILGQCLRDCALKLFDEWRPKFIAEGVKMLPIHDTEVAELIFSRTDYLPVYVPKTDCAPVNNSVELPEQIEQVEQIEQADKP